MAKKGRIQRLSKEFNTLGEQEKNYILGLTKALSFAAKNGGNLPDSRNNIQKRKKSMATAQ